jgi:protein-tyrosine phosphatase
MNKILTGVFCIAVIFSACYAEIEPQPPSERGGLLPIAGAFNLRDIGGYKTTDGKTVKNGKLIRSGDLNLLTVRDQDYLFKDMGIKTVVDFRSENRVVDSNLIVSTERSQAPDRLPPGVAVWDKSGGNSTAIPESIVVPAYEVIMRDAVTYPDVSAVITKVAEGYKNLVTDGRSQAAYKSFFDALLASNGEPVLYHCSAGKDRAGVATALLLKALGVSDDDIIANYMLSAGFVAEKYYPVIPFVVKSTKDELNSSKPLIQLISSYGKPGAKSYLVSDPPASIIQGIKQATMQSMLNNPMCTEEEARAMGELAAQNPTAISGAIDALLNQLEPLVPYLANWDAAVEAAATGTGEKIKPLLTVDTRYIQAALSQLETMGGISAYLGSDTITKLKALYLE